jgi:uncharacterized protein YrrD
MAETSDCGSPIAYLVLQPGTAVFTSARERIGTVERVLFVQEEDVFDGIVVQTGDGARFVDASDVESIFERCVITSLSLEQAKTLSPPEQAPAVYGVDPAQGTGTSLGDRFHRWFGKARWSKR